MPIFIHDHYADKKHQRRCHMKLEIEIKADHIDWKALLAKVNEAIEEETTELSSVEISYSESEEED